MTRSILAQAPSLRAVQRALAAHIRGAPPPDDLSAWLALPRGAAVAERLAVYAGGYPARLAEALHEQFPALAHLVGARRFHALVHRYIAAAGLTSYSLNHAGAELAAFLRDDELTAELPFVADLARLEWAVACAFHAAEAAPLDAAALAHWSIADWAAAVLRLQPSVAVIRSDWPLRALWEARDTPIDAIDIDLTAAAAVLVRRDGYAVVCESLSAGAASALLHLQDGAVLGDVIDRLAAEGVGADTALAWFGGWMRAGMVAAVERALDASQRPAQPARRPSTSSGLSAR